jgi:hypothetical protein
MPGTSADSPMQFWSALVWVNVIEYHTAETDSAKEGQDDQSVISGRGRAGLPLSGEADQPSRTASHESAEEAGRFVVERVVQPLHLFGVAGDVPRKRDHELGGWG